jgi:hypothetical protein
MLKLENHKFETILGNCSEFQASLSFIKTPCLKKQKPKNPHLCICKIVWVNIFKVLKEEYITSSNNFPGKAVLQKRRIKTFQTSKSLESSSSLDPEVFFVERLH